MKISRVHIWRDYHQLNALIENRASEILLAQPNFISWSRHGAKEKIQKWMMSIETHHRDGSTSRLPEWTYAVSFKKDGLTVCWWADTNKSSMFYSGLGSISNASRKIKQQNENIRYLGKLRSFYNDVRSIICNDPIYQLLTAANQNTFYTETEIGK